MTNSQLQKCSWLFVLWLPCSEKIIDKILCVWYYISEKKMEAIVLLSKNNNKNLNKGGFYGKADN